NDICYTSVDIEDGFKLGRLSFNEVEDILIRILGSPPKRYNEVEAPSERISYLRAKCIGRLIGEVSDIFKDHEALILAGNFKGDLLAHSRRADIFKEIHTRSEEHTSELQSRENLVCRLLLEKKKNTDL